MNFSEFPDDHQGQPSGAPPGTYLSIYSLPVLTSWTETLGGNTKEEHIDDVEKNAREYTWRMHLGADLVRASLSMSAAFLSHHGENFLTSRYEGGYVEVDTDKDLPSEVTIECITKYDRAL